MALKNMKKINSKLQDIYKDQVTTTVATQPEPFVDRSELLLEQMNFIATYNKQLLHIA
jgi:5'(3')-deoxyribonucleotidase